MIRPAIKFAALAAYLAASALSLSACNTTEGFGKDVKDTGKTIEEKAKENK